LTVPASEFYARLHKIDDETFPQALHSAEIYLREANIERLAKTSSADFVAELMRRYALPLVVIDRLNAEAETHFIEFDPLGRPKDDPYVALIMVVPFTPPEGRNSLTAIVDFNGGLLVSDNISILDGDGYFQVKSVVGTGSSIEPIMEQALQALSELVDTYNKSAERANLRLREKFFALVEARQEFVLSFDAGLRQACQRLRVKLTRDLGPTVDLEVRHKIQVLREPAKPSNDPELSHESFTAVLAALKCLGQQFEVAPAAYAKLKEPDFRHIILATLNTIFHANGTAEAFSGRGKTDIYLNVPGAIDVLVAECKYWSGVKAFREALAQLLGYLQWSHNYGVLLVFCKKESMTKAFNEYFQAIRTAPSAMPGGAIIDLRHHSTMHSHPTDAEKRVEVHTIFINLAAQATPKTDAAGTSRKLMQRGESCVSGQADSAS